MDLGLLSTDLLTLLVVIISVPAVLAGYIVGTEFLVTRLPDRRRLQVRPWTYVIYSSAVFSLIHVAYGDSILMLNTFLVGIVWGVAYLRMRNIWPVILSHAAIGTLAFSLGLA